MIQPSYQDTSAINWTHFCCAGSTVPPVAYRKVKAGTCARIQKSPPPLPHTGFVWPPTAMGLRALHTLHTLLLRNWVPCYRDCLLSRKICFKLLENTPWWLRHKRVLLPGRVVGTVGATPRAAWSDIGAEERSIDLDVLTATRDMMTGIWNVELYERTVARLLTVWVTNSANTPLDINSQTTHETYRLISQHTLFILCHSRQTIFITRSNPSLLQTCFN